MTAEEIKALRERLSISQRELAQRIGVAKATVQFWEQGRGKPKRTTADILQSLEE
jgi:DNA-binding transcriptional regulator YiaG